MYHKNAIEAVACDDKIEKGWFRFDMITGNDMPVTCHFEGDCGTDNPIWLNGSLPSADDGVINGTVCVKNSTVCCAKTYDIQLKNCSTYNVYHLPPVSQCAERYCIGDKVLCPPGTISEDGFEPGCSDNFPNITQQPDIQVDERVERYIFENITKKELMFTCLPFYDQVPADKLSLLFFDVKWYINSQLVHEEDNVDVADLPAQLRESVWLSKSITLGFQVKCRVKGKYVQDGELVGARSLAVESPEFFAGIKVLNSSDFPIRIKENDPNPAIIAFQPTVPILCTDIPVFDFYCEDIFLQVEVRIPQQWKQALCPSEGGVSQRQEAVVEACGIQINAKHWNKTVTLKIAPVIDGIYDGDQITKVLLSTAEFNVHQAWSNYRLPDIPILVIDTDMTLKGLVCMANSDPHMMTFDGVRYECQLPGEFIMYKHQTLPIQVHGFFKKCNNGRAFCPCAVTVMSGGDLFIFDRCRAGTGSQTTKGIKKPMRSGLLGCEHGQMRAESFNNAKDFKIYLPTGGYVYARSYYYIDDYYMNIHIHPGSKDVESTVGLCGTLNGNQNDDFLRRDGTTDPISLYPDDFSLSWRVSDASDSMYNGIPASSNVTSIQAEYCRCPTTGDQIVFNSSLPLDCSYTENVAKCASDNSYSVKQLAKCRKRRAAASHDEIFEIRKFEYNADDRIEEPEWKNGWTEAKADEFCSNYIYNSSAGKACQAVENVDYEVALKGCKDDIHLTGDNAWALAALDSIKGMCVGELSKNESYWVVDNSTGEVALPEELDVIKCPNDCSSNGVCTRNNGTSSCECYPGYVSSDCSISRDTIPDLYYMPTNGLCDISQRPCLETPVYGGPFVQSSNLSCKTEHLTASGVITEYNDAEFVHEEEVICPFPKLRQKRSDISSDEVIKVYNISISNSGTNYSHPLKVAVYDSKCYRCDGPSQCHLKNGTCSINGKCYNNEEQNPSDACQICNPNVTTSDWYLRPSTCTIDNQCYTDGQERTGSFCDVCSSDKNRNSWDIKNGTCRIGEMCYKENDTNPDDPCQICIPSWNKTAWYIQSNACRINGSCYHKGEAQEGKSCKVCNPAVNITDWVLLNETCYVNSTCYNSSDRNPSEPCELCDPKYSTETWFELNGTCSINGSCYNETQQNPARPCQICDPRVSNTKWTQLNETCELDGKCISNLQSRSGHMCHICSPSTSRTSWTIKNGTCSINGSCYNETQQNQARPCQICDPRLSNTEWTDLSESCEIDGSCISNQVSKDGHPCHICSPGTSRTSWTIKNGTCSINGVCYNETQQNPARPCQICDPRVSNTEWTDLDETCEIEGSCISNLKSRDRHICHICSPSTSTTSWTIKNGTCSISGLCYNETQQNPAWPCQICDPSASNTEWTDLSENCEIEGICIGSLESRRDHLCHICSPSTSRTSWTIKNGTCSINGSCYNETEQNPARPCQICDPRLSDTEWTDLNETCELDGKCISKQKSKDGHMCHICSPSTSTTSWTIKNGTCSMNGSCYNETQQNPAKPCQICDPRVSNTKWTDLSERCEIEGRCIGSLELKDGHMCHICSPSTSRTSWTVKNGTCSINGSCYNETQQNPARPCQICDPRVSNTEWTDLNGTCSINGSCYNETQQNPTRPCQICDPNVSKTNWTDQKETCELDGKCISNLQSRDGHMCHICSPSTSRTSWTIKNGTCSINGSCYNETQQNPARPCQICDPRVSNTEWTQLSERCEIEGRCIGSLEARDGHVCHICSSGTSRTSWTIKNGTCSINGSCYNETQQNPARPCQICDPRLSNTEWTQLNEACELDGKCISNLQSRDGHICHICSPSTSTTSWTIKNGTCSINGLCYNETQQNPARPCQICDPRVSQTEWTDLNGTCTINGLCYNETQQNPARPCQICDPTVSNTQWTDLSESCEIEGSCIGNLESRDGHMCHICSPNISTTSWTIKNGTCSINGSCYNETQHNPTRPCQICDPSMSQTEWIILNNTCLIDGVCYNTCQANPVDNTTVCHSSTTAYNWTSADVCDHIGSAAEAPSVSDASSQIAIVLGGVLGSISFIAVTLIVVAAIRHTLHWKSKQKKRKNVYLKSNLGSSLSKTPHLGYVHAQNTNMLRGDRYIGDPAAIGRDNQGYQSSTERRYERGSKQQDNIRHQPVYMIGPHMHIPPPDY